MKRPGTWDPGAQQRDDLEFQGMRSCSLAVHKAPPVGAANASTATWSHPTVTWPGVAADEHRGLIDR